MMAKTKSKPKKKTVQEKQLDALRMIGKQFAKLNKNLEILLERGEDDMNVEWEDD